MLLFVFVIIVLSALIELDNVYAGQFMLARPSVTGLILGVFFGDFTLAVQLGIFFELMYLDNMPMGGIVPPSGVISVTTAFIFAHFTQTDVAFAFLWGLTAGVLYARIEMKLRNMRSSWTEKIEEELPLNPSAVNKWVAKGITQQFAVGMFFMLIYVGFVLSFIEGLWTVMPVSFKEGIKLAYFAIPWMGLTMLVRSLRPPKKAQ